MAKKQVKEETPGRVDYRGMVENFRRKQEKQILYYKGWSYIFAFWTLVFSLLILCLAFEYL